VSQAADAARPATAAERETRRIVRAIVILALGGLVVLTLTTLPLLQSRELAAALMTALASFAVGNVLGFVFGVPRMGEPAATGDANGDGGAQRRASVHNTNMVAISDWLTKILVGIGLVEARRIIVHFGNLASSASFAMSGGSSTGPILGASVILAFGAVGFLAAYLWTTRYLPKALATSQQEALIASALDKVKSDQDDLRQIVGDVAKTNEEITRTQDEVRKLTGNLEAIAKATLSGTIDTPRTVTAEADNAAAGAAPRIAADAPAYVRAIVPNANIADDPWKGALGGAAESNGLRLSVTVSPEPVLVTDPARPFHALTLTVSAIDPARPLAGTVWFLLHPSYPNWCAPVEVRDGRAVLETVGWGAFTAGAVAEDGQTKLELDIAQLPGLPSPFKDL